MKRKTALPSGILAAGMFAARVTCQAQVYAQGFYSAGMSDYCVCSATLPFLPFKYNLTKKIWLETSNGVYLWANMHPKEPGDVWRQSLEVTSGSNVFHMPLDSGPPTEFKSSYDQPITKGSGNLASVVIQCATNRGGRPATNTLPMVQASWRCQSRTNADIIALDGDHFKEVRNLLEQAFGKPDPAIHSDIQLNGHSITYTPTQTGIFLSLTGTWDGTTIISIIGKQPP